MFFLTPPYLKHGRQFLKDARKLLAYKRDLVSPATADAVEREIGHLEVALGSGEKADVEAQMHRLDEACGKLTKPHPDAVWRENVEVFLVAIVIALAVRTYFLQPFTIPTGSMQPTLFGIIGHPTDTPPPNPLKRVLDFALFGRTYVNVLSKADDEVIVGTDEVKRLFLFTYTRLQGSSGNVYFVHAPKAAVDHDFMRGEPKAYKTGEPIIRGFVNTGDHVFVDKFTYNFRPPKRGQVFVFTTLDIPRLTVPGQTSQFYIKRLAGRPNDTLRIKPPHVFINGEIPVSAPFQRVMAGTEDHPVDGYYGYSNHPEGQGSFTLLGYPDATVTLDSTQYFALGDNSYHSSDSRAWGPVPEKNIMGRGVIVYWPFNAHWGFIH